MRGRRLRYAMAAVWAGLVLAESDSGGSDSGGSDSSDADSGSLEVVSSSGQFSDHPDYTSDGIGSESSNGQEQPNTPKKLNPEDFRDIPPLGGDDGPIKR